MCVVVVRVWLLYVCSYFMHVGVVCMWLLNMCDCYMYVVGLVCVVVNLYVYGCCTCVVAVCVLL